MYIFNSQVSHSVFLCNMSYFSVLKGSLSDRNHLVICKFLFGETDDVVQIILKSHICCGCSVL